MLLQLYHRSINISGLLSILGSAGAHALEVQTTNSEVGDKKQIKRSLRISESYQSEYSTPKNKAITAPRREIHLSNPICTCLFANLSVAAASFTFGNLTFGTGKFSARHKGSQPSWTPKKKSFSSGTDCFRYSMWRS